MTDDPRAPVKALIAALTKSLSLQVRIAPASGDYLEAVMRRQDLPRCFELLQQTFGPPAKEFGKPAKFDREVKRIVDALGGIWDDQGLFTKGLPGGATGYAALWPWASDASKITLKVGAAPPP